MTYETQDLDTPSLTCEQTVRLLWDYLDNELSQVDVNAVDHHLRVCHANCTSHFVFERAFLDITRASRGAHVASPGLRAQVAAILGGSYPDTSGTV